LDKIIKVKNGGNMALIYVTGGAKSGKSMFAEELLLGMNNGNQKNIYLATSIVFDEEMKVKVALHKERRQDKWLTVESYKNFSETLKDVLSDERKDNMLVDCLTNMISNIIFEEQDINWDKPSEKDFEEFSNILTVYEQENGGVIYTAEKLFMHKNTLQYKLNKIKRLSGYDPRNLKDFTILSLAFKLKNLE